MSFNVNSFRILHIFTAQVLKSKPTSNVLRYSRSNLFHNLNDTCTIDPN